MENMLSDAVSQVPALAVLAGIVVVFVKDRASSQKMFADSVESFQDQIGKLFEQNTDKVRDCREIQDGTSQCVKESTSAVRELLIELRHDREQRRATGG
jgi:hypothetical protein